MTGLLGGLAAGCYAATTGLYAGVAAILYAGATIFLVVIVGLDLGLLDSIVKLRTATGMMGGSVLAGLLFGSFSYDNWTFAKIR